MGYTIILLDVLEFLASLNFTQLCEEWQVLTFYSLLVMWCTNRFDIQQLYILPTLYLCVLYLSQNK